MFKSEWESCVKGGTIYREEEAEQKGSQKVFQYKRRPVPKEFLGIKELKHSVNCRNRTPSRKSIRNSTAAAAGRPTPFFWPFSFLCNTPATTHTYVRQNPLVSSSSIPFWKWIENESAGLFNKGWWTQTKLRQSPSFILSPLTRFRGRIRPQLGNRNCWTW